MLHSRNIFASLGFAAVLITSANANNLITNGSFENGSYSFNGGGGESLGVGSTVMTGWTVVTAELAAIENGDAYGMVAQDGNISLDLTGYHDSSPYGGVEQTISTVAGQTYTLQFYIGAQNNSGSYAAPVSINASINGGTATTFYNNSTGSGQQWVLASQSFVATGTSTTIDLIGNSSAGGQYIGLDNVSVTQSVPEPNSIAALGCGLLGLIGLKKRKSHI